MAQTKETLARTLGNIQQTRMQFVGQLAQLEGQLQAAHRQLEDFDALIAILQVSISDPLVLSQVEVQADMNALVPLTAPAGEQAPSPAGSEGAAA